MEPTKYWKGIDELNNDAAFIEQKQKEFAEEVPVDEIIADTLTKKSSGRRDFLKMVGFSVTAATVAASCRIPIKKAIPYAIAPEEITPGIANYYASTYADGTEYCSVLVKVRDGRPIKIEGNTHSNITRGGTSARVQASVLSLYDKNRPQGPKKSGVNIEWTKLDAEVRERLAAGAPIRILSSTIISPSTRAVISDFMRAYPNTRHVVYEPMSYSAVADAHQQSHGKRVVPGYNFDKAQVIVGFSCDFLGTWLSPVEFAKQYISNRKVSKENPRMSRHIHFESRLSLTGSNADTRVPVKPSDEKKALVALHNRIAGGSASVTLPKNVEAAVNRTADELLAARGNALVVCGLNDVNCQVLVNAINSALGSYGATIDTTRVTQAGQANDKDVMDLVGEMNGGGVGVLIIYNSNPAYSIHGFGEALKKVQTSIAISDKRTETANICTYVAPDHHYLESWNDAEPRTGSYSLCQPTISPMFNTRQAQDTLLLWSGSTVPYLQYLQQRWGGMNTGSTGLATATNFWNNALRFGVHEGAIAAPVLSTSGVNPSSNATATAATAATVASTTNAPSTPVDASSAAGTLAGTASSGMELVLYEKVGLGNGKYANNPWLQELPDPITKATWDNYALLPVQYAADNGIANGDVVTLKAGNVEVSLPAIVQPGQPNGSVAVAVGYGRTDVGPAGNSVGRNVFPMAAFDGRSFQYTGMAATVSKTGDKAQLAQTQTHHTIEGRDIIKETTLAAYAQNPMSGNEARKKYGELNETTLYPRHEYAAKATQLRWYMNIDLSSCIGCGACAVACNAENNVPVVGKNEVARVHEMHWLRIDRYYSFNNPNSNKLADRVTKEKEYDPSSSKSVVNDYENVNVTYQPMLCQHCEHAPCENVCPVAATNHSSEGLNQMAYNRCVGTRYCANNCPYKVRRFNWFDYTLADSFPYNTAVETQRLGMLDNLTRMVLNPDVTVRSRGVMEKCTFCVQRLQDTKLQAKKEERPIRDGEAITACAQACPTNAIVFGNIHDPNSMVRKLNDDERTFYVLQEIHTMPAIGYMTKVRNIQENNNA